MNNKGNIKKEEQFIQCKKDFNYIKDNLQNYKEINVDKYINIINKILEDIYDEKNEIKNNNDKKEEK